MKKAERVEKIIEVLDRTYPDPHPPLNFSSPFELLIAVILSAQCTDERVNQVTPALFRVATTPEAILELGEEKLKSYIRPTGFFNAKAHNIIKACRTLMEEFNGELPRTLEELQRLGGVGRKTASVVICQAFGVPAFPVDRHVFRVAQRLDLARAKTPDETDRQLRKVLPKKQWIPLHLQLVFLGRQWCRPRPLCESCPLLELCPTGAKNVEATKKTKPKGISKR